MADLLCCLGGSAVGWTKRSAWWRVVAAGARLAMASALVQREQGKRLRGEGLAVKNGRVVGFAAVRFLGLG